MKHGVYPIKSVSFVNKNHILTFINENINKFQNQSDNNH